jgi:hypothetical protein
MNRKTIAALWIAMLTVASLAAQSASPTFYAETARKGPTRITEDKFDIKLTPDNANYKQRLKDSMGAERYELTINPKISEGEGKDKITGWELSLRDLRHSIYGNLLRFDLQQSDEPRDNLFWLNPQRTAAVPIRARRIIKVDSFYVVFQAKDFHFAPAYSPYLDSMSLTVEFTNSDPRNEGQ